MVVKENNIVSIRRKKGVSLVTVVAAAAVAMGTSAFTDTNTVPNNFVGEGVHTTDGYTASSIQYNLQAADPTKVDWLHFHLVADDGATGADTVKVQVAGSWFTCSLAVSAIAGPSGNWTSGPNDPVCDLTGTNPAASAISSIDIAATKTSS